MIVGAAFQPYLIPGLAVGVLAAILAWRNVAKFRAQHGTTQWGAPPWLWALLFFFSWVPGLFVLEVAKKSTLRDISASHAAPDTRRPTRARKVAAVVLFVLGPAAIVAGILGPGSPQHNNLAGFTVARPDATMVATAIGRGGAQPSVTLPAAHQGSGVDGTTFVPTTPVIYLTPATLTNYGVPTGKEAAYWKVWWDGGAQQQDVVSLSQRINATSASNEVTQLASRNSNPAQFDQGGLTFASVGSFTVPGIPGSNGLLWNGTDRGKQFMQFRFVVFSRGSVAALVSTSNFRGSVDPAAFQSFALAEYRQLADSPDSSPSALVLGLLVGLGVMLVLAGVITLIGALYRPRPAGPDIASFPPPAPDSRQPVGPESAGRVPAGWYPDPSGSGESHYWNGWQWLPPPPGSPSEEQDTGIPADDPADNSVTPR